MRHRAFGRTKVRVPIVGQGTWQMDGDDRASAIAALQRGFDLGLTHVDTAEMYGDGEVEQIVGEAIHGRRDELYLVSKVLPHHATRRGTVAACERSLKRLGTDRLDLYLLHWPGSHPLAHTIDGFRELVATGKILAWGVSNFSADELSEALALAPDDPPACNQVLYHVEQRAIEHRVLPLCERERVALVAYSPFGQNDFPGPQSRAGRTLHEIGVRHGASARQVALAFLLRSDAVFVIPKASQTKHVEDNAGAARLELTDAEIAEIDAVLPRGRARRDVPML